MRGLGSERFTASSYYDESYLPENVGNDDSDSYFATALDDTNQWLRIDFIWSKRVRGVYIAVEQSDNNTGTFVVYVSAETNIDTVILDDSTKCDTQNDVGVNAAGGAFNCNSIYGRYMYIYCEILRIYISSVYLCM